MVSQWKRRSVESILEAVAGIKRFSGSSPPSHSLYSIFLITITIYNIKK